MSKGRRNIRQYETELFKLKEEGLTVKEIGARFGLSYEQTHDFFKRQNRKKRKIAAGIAIGKQGRPAKDSVVTKEDKLADLRYTLARKDARIKQLEMENELMRDFLSLTGRK